MSKEQIAARFPDCVCCFVDSLQGYPAASVVVSRPDGQGGMEELKVLPMGATDRQVRLALLKAAATDLGDVARKIEARMQVQQAPMYYQPAPPVNFGGGFRSMPRGGGGRRGGGGC